MQLGGAPMRKMAELYACLYAKEFPAQALLRLRPDIGTQACVVLEGGYFYPTPRKGKNSFSGAGECRKSTFWTPEAWVSIGGRTV
jgi:hypothetical protein